MRALKLILSLSAALLLFSCGGKKDSGRTAITSGRGTTNGTVNPLLNRDNQVNGNTSQLVQSAGLCAAPIGQHEGIIYNSMATYTYTDTIAAFLTAYGDPYASQDQGGMGLTEVSGACNGDTGVSFSASVSLQQGIYNVSNVNNNSSMMTQGEVIVAVFDAMTRDYGAQAIGVSGNLNYGFVNGTEFYMIMDTYDGSGQNSGQLLFDGLIQGNKISGQVYFGNYVNYSGGGAIDGQLGQFEIPTCSILPCN